MKQLSVKAMFTQYHRMISPGVWPAAEIDAGLRRMSIDLLGISVLFAVGIGLVAVRVAMVMGRMT